MNSSIYLSQEVAKAKEYLAVFVNNNELSIQADDIITDLEYIYESHMGFVEKEANHDFHLGGLDDCIPYIINCIEMGNQNIASGLGEDTAPKSPIDLDASVNNEHCFLDRLAAESKLTEFSAKDMETASLAFEDAQGVSGSNYELIHFVCEIPRYIAWVERAVKFADAKKEVA